MHLAASRTHLSLELCEMFGNVKMEGSIGLCFFSLTDYRYLCDGVKCCMMVLIAPGHIFSPLGGRSKGTLKSEYLGLNLSHLTA